MANWAATFWAFISRHLGDFRTHQDDKKEEWESKEIVTEINKITLGKCIIKFCGNEGAENSTSQQYLRKLLQGCIDSLEKHPGVDWSNAVLEIYGEDGTPYKVISGRGKHTLYALIDEKQEIQIIKRR